ncbi:hypothetical protein N0V93_003328 [Gnomoniopsis smithogilvyi]|uniref:Uncharacterized protein n=1 Tax=Gnomoniopsis smithogilvyi TaxID=1191159 RepID=A0A9W8YYF9_9PEZI|nr:hypothetical protein N0V93_003328 [Gnomoniopsis smithogilvyi]
MKSFSALALVTLLAATFTVASPTVAGDMANPLNRRACGPINGRCDDNGCEGTNDQTPYCTAVAHVVMDADQLLDLATPTGVKGWGIGVLAPTKDAAVIEVLFTEQETEWSAGLRRRRREDAVLNSSSCFPL